MIILTEGRKEFLAWAKVDVNEPRAKGLLDDFLANRKKFPAPQNDMDWWVKNKRPVDLSMYISSFKSNTQKEKEERIAGSEKLYDDGRWAAIRCDEYSAMKHYGSGSKWCISGRYPGHEGDSRGKYYFDEYLKSNYNSYTVVIDRKGEEGNNKWCVCIKKKGGIDIWNAKDNTVEYIPGNVPEIPGLPPLGALTIRDGELVACMQKRGDVELPEGITKIHQKLFMDTDIHNITFPSTLEEIGAGVCANTDVHRVTIPDSVTKLCRGVCLSCDYLKEVTIGSGVKEIPGLCFSYCNDLTKIALLGGDKMIDEKAFFECGGSKKPEIYVEGDDCTHIIEWAKDKNVYIINSNTMEIIGGSNE